MLMVQYKKEKIQNIDIHNIETKAYILYDTTQFFCAISLGGNFPNNHYANYESIWNLKMIMKSDTVFEI